jgi:predicted lipoprotein with Yx(FWY)xxD motif
MARLTLAALLAAALIAVGCGDDDANGNGASGSDTAMESDEAMSSEEKMGSGEAMKDEEKMKGDEAMAAEAGMSATGAGLTVVDSDYGSVIADRKGEALYLFDKEDGKKSECYGACASVWPPMLTKGKPKAAAGAKQRLLGTTRRRNGKLQVTYAGHPLYYYVDDSPGTILCHDVAEFGGLWLVVKPNGQPA